jgi:GT2 family glycosyltransferase
VTGAPQHSDRGAAASPRTLAVVITYRSADIVGRCLDSLAGLADPGLSVLVVDNDSPDDTVAVVQRHLAAADPDFAARVQVVPSGGNLGFARGVNIGLRRALELDVDQVLLLNPDATVGPGVTTEAAAVLADPAVGLFSPLITYPDGVVWSAGVRLLGKRELLTALHFGVAKNIDKGVPAGPEVLDRRDVDAVTGCAMVIPRATIRRVGPFDSSFFMYAEDSDYSERVRAAGLRTVVSGRARVVHHTRDREVTGLRSAFGGLRKYRMFLVGQVRYLWKRSPLSAVLWTAEIPVMLVAEFARRVRHR